ncbi:MAG TPA: cellulose-binding protein [Ktedonobacterales bacterium]|nr:cellulose-binding protein [Ktedonobacterales bacterium]
MLTTLKARHIASSFLYALALLLALATSQGGNVSASNAVQVTVKANAPLGTIPETAFGMNTAVWDSQLLDPHLPSLLKQAGTTMLRFPGGSTADAYHWRTNSLTAGQGGYVNPSNTFDAFLGVARQTDAQAMLTVNYGSNAAGTAGGDPQEAADWVKYANITKHYGVRYWEIGNEIYGNGTYGSRWEVDLHKQTGPVAYAQNALAFIHAMKDADPSIQVGVVLTAPGRWPDGLKPDWNRNVLSIACQAINFVDVHWYPQDPKQESDAGLLNSTSQIASMVSTLRARIKQYCGSHASQVGIMVTETNSVSFNPGKQTTSPVNALFLADNYMNWLENGVANVDWWDIHNSITTGQNNSPALYGDTQYGDYGVLSSGQSSSGISEPSLDTPFPSYYGMQMLTRLGHSGDQMLSASSSQPLLSVHAVKQQDGRLAILLINKDPSTNYNVSFALPGYHSASTATIYSYGKSGNAIQQTPDPAFGSTLSEDIPPYSLVTIVLTP